MEGSMDSSMNRALPSKHTDSFSEEEESGWTMYFDDFLSPENRETSNCSTDYRVSPSWVSDAASCAAAELKLSNHVEISTMPTKICKNLSFKKRRTRVALEDESLEDTASSPVNSPKVSDQQKFGMKLSKGDDNGSCQGKEMGSGICSQMQADDRNVLSLMGNEHTELKKKGLCLVPLSMLAHYL